MKVIAVIPVHGRVELLKQTISRLYTVNKISHVICIGDEEQQVCESYGAEFIHHDNQPLGKKWNAGYQAAEKHRPDAVLNMGSNQWFSDNWLPEMSRRLEKNMLVGKREINVLEFGDSGLRMCRWLMYPRDKFRLKHYFAPKEVQRFIRLGGRQLEPVGAGRLLRSDFLDAINWRPFSDELTHGLDMNMMGQLTSVSGSWGLVDQPNIQSLKITSHKWENLNSYDLYMTFPTVREIITPVEFLAVWFPDALNLKI